MFLAIVPHYMFYFLPKKSGSFFLQKNLIKCPKIKLKNRYNIEISNRLIITYKHFHDKTFTLLNLQKNFFYPMSLAYSVCGNQPH